LGHRHPGDEGDWKEYFLAGVGKAKERCPACGASLTLCMCEELPRLELTTKISLIIHHRELSRSSNTGLLALRALVNSEMRVRGETREPLDLTDLLTPEYRTFLLFPAANARELDRRLVETEKKPIQLIVPDGTWRQARKLHTRHRELNALPRVKIATPIQVTYQLRAQYRPEGMATLQAIACALGIIEGETVAARLLALYRARVERTLTARGQLRQMATSPGSEG
jgi:DTW domain-containing protein YfiP